MYLKFKENHICGGTATITVSEEKAIEFTRKCNNHINMTDDEAVKHFMLINEAEYVDDYGEGECLDRPI
jgi:hypothetical protein